MGKGSGACDRPGISLGIFDGAETESTLNGGAAPVSEINTTLEIQWIGKQWWTKDEAVVFRKRKQGWVVFSYSNAIRKAFEEYGLIHQQAGTSSYEHTFLPSLQAARQAVTDVSVEAGLNIDSRLTRQRYIAYKIGDLPLRIRREEGHWRVFWHSLVLSPSLEKYFNSMQEFLASWASTGIRFAHYPTRKAAHQAVTNWLAQTITKK
jgi:hypothetical protein